MLDADIQKILRERILNLTAATYRVTDFFSKMEILRSHLRAKATEIFGLVSEWRFDADTDSDQEARIIAQKIETIKGYLMIAGTLNYVRPVNFAILQREYSEIQRYIEENRGSKAIDPIKEDEFCVPLPAAILSAGLEKDEPSGASELSSPEIITKETSEYDKMRGVFYKYKEERPYVNERQKIIIDYVQKAGNAKISDFFNAFQDISSKTIQRDLQYLVDMRMLKREGEKRWTTYSLSDSNIVAEHTS